MGQIKDQNPTEDIPISIHEHKTSQVRNAIFIVPHQIKGMFEWCVAWIAPNFDRNRPRLYDSPQENGPWLPLAVDSERLHGRIYELDSWIWRSRLDCNGGLVQNHSVATASRHYIKTLVTNKLMMTQEYMVDVRSNLVLPRPANKELFKFVSFYVNRKICWCYRFVTSCVFFFLGHRLFTFTSSSCKK